MKLAFIAFLLFVGTISAQIPKASEDKCTEDIQALVALLYKLGDDYASNKVAALIADAVKAQYKWYRVQIDCNLPSNQVLANLNDSQINPELRECTNQIIITIKSAKNVIAVVQSLSKTAITTAATELMTAVKNLRNKCTAAAFKAIPK